MGPTPTFPFQLATVIDLLNILYYLKKKRKNDLMASLSEQWCTAKVSKRTAILDQQRKSFLRTAILYYYYNYFHTKFLKKN